MLPNAVEGTIPGDIPRRRAYQCTTLQELFFLFFLLPGHTPESFPEDIANGQSSRSSPGYSFFRGTFSEGQASGQSSRTSPGYMPKEYFQRKLQEVDPGGQFQAIFPWGCTRICQRTGSGDNFRIRSSAGSWCSGASIFQKRYKDHSRACLQGRPSWSTPSGEILGSNSSYKKTSLDLLDQYVEHPDCFELHRQEVLGAFGPKNRSAFKEIGPGACLLQPSP